MIDFRYHIVSITAVFLALGIGVAVGATVLNQVSVEALRSRLDDLSGDLDARRADITELRADLGRTQSLARDLAPRVTAGALAGQNVVFVDATGAAGWVDSARKAVVGAGATDVGTIEITARWDGAQANEELAGIALETGVATSDVVDDYARLLGQLMLRPAGASYVAALSDAGYVSARASDGDWPPPATGVVVFTEGTTDDEAPATVAAFAAGAATSTPTMVAGASVEEPGAVALLGDDSVPGGRLVTFDSTEEDTTGVGVVLALRAAVDARGGQFGRGSGLSYLPPA